jgi:hypothetical protein
MEKKYYWFSFILLACMLSSCASFSSKINKSEKSWQKFSPGDPTDIGYSVFLVGDAGAAQNEKLNPALDALKEELKNSSPNSICLFLGDNIYPSGLPHPDDPGYAEAQSALLAQLYAVSDFKGKSYFIPGNHDWYGGMESLKRQEKFIDQVLGRKSFLPQDGCAGPVEVDLNDDITMVIIDSQWFLEDWTQHPDFNESCNIKTREDLVFEMRDIIRKNRDKYLLIALHHPLESYGIHGGYYSLRSHLFPLTDVQRSLYLPLPFIGSATQVLRKNIGKVQELNHPLYRNFIESIKNVSSGFNNIIFVSGHEHNQQLIEKNDQYYVVSGSGSKTSEVKLGPGSLYASGKPGFSRIDYYDDGRVWITFYEVDKDGNHSRAFQKELSLEKPDPANVFPEDFPIYYSGEDTIITSIYSDTTDRSGIYKSLFGEHYGILYSIDIKAPVFDLYSFREGLRPVKRGGGSQTSSLRLELPDGRQYVMRAIKKDVEKLLPKGFAKTFAFDLLEDQFMSAHPYAAFAIPGMAEAADIMHTHPELYYIPKQPGLEYFNEYYGNELYLFEERADGNRSDLKNFGYSEKIISTSDLLNELYKDKEAVVDQKAVVRARLFDILLNDWDRHDDQWRWARFIEGEKEVYRPIPRDRDQAFVKFDGWITGILNNTIPVFGQMRSFDYEIPDVKAICHNARWFDRSFLNALSWEDWQQEAEHLMLTLTPEAIRSSVMAWPDEIFDLTGEEVIHKLISRLKKLDIYAREYYNFLNQTVDIPGTEDRDTFTLETLDNNALSVRLTSEGSLKYYRVFDSEITKEIRLYGRSAEDVFLVNSSIASGIKIYLMGGPGEDTYTSSRPARLVDKVVIRENKEENNYFLPQAKIITSNKPKYYTYNRNAFQYNYHLIYPNLSFTPDDGVMLGVNLNYVKHGFMKWPYSSSHNISGSIGLASSSYRFHYSGAFTSIVGERDLLVDLDVFSPQYVTNFFGFGNETTITNSNRDFYRIRNQLFSLKLNLQRRYQNGGFLQYGLLGETRKVLFKENAFISEDPVYLPYFEFQTFVGGNLRYIYSNIDIKHNPTRGLKFIAGTVAKFRPNKTSQKFFRFSTELTIYQELLDARRIVLGLRSGYEVQFGETDFYQVITLGGDSQIRGYRNERFAGQGSFYVNSDLRIRLGEKSNYFIPFIYGINMGFDMGRVWIKEEVSSTWHKSYGGGVWLSPFDFTTLTINYFVGDDEGRYTVGLGFFF